MTVLYTAVAWAHILTTGAAFVVCLLYVGRSLWARVLAGAFLLQILVSLFYQLINVMGWHVYMATRLTLFYGLASLVGLVASIGVVVGLAGAFAQIAGMQERASQPRAPRVPVEPA